MNIPKEVILDLLPVYLAGEVSPATRAWIEEYLAQNPELAERVRITGRSLQLEPMNSYERRLVHNAFKDDPDVATWSPSDSARIKQITLLKRQPKKEPAQKEG